MACTGAGVIHKDAAWRKTILPKTSVIKDVISSMNMSSLKIVLIINDQGQLEGTISDGDIRRALLRGLTLESPIEQVVHRSALVVPPAMGRDMVLQLMVANRIQQIPVVGEDNVVLGLHIWEEITTSPKRSNCMIIMAGGKGIRLRPYTENCPKPLVEVAGKPMLEHIIERAKLEGITNFLIAIHYLGHMIEEYFGNGEKLGVHIKYLREESPLGTAGALSLLEAPPEDAFIVTNGDVVTDIHYGDLLDFHIRHNATGTMAVRVHEWQHPYGVVKTSGLEIIGFEEKPITRSHINAGVYVLSPGALNMLDRGAHCDMPTLFERLQANQLRTVAYPMHEPWLDVGRPDDLKKANETIGREVDR
jgi:dTDP-glucose pyrophosphorylase